MKLSFSLLMVLFFTSTQSQNSNTYLSDLASLKSIIQKTPSYRDQIKGESLVAYNELYERLTHDSLSTIFDYHYFYNLAQLFFPIRDNHLGFYQIDKIPSKAQYPTFNGNSDSLKLALQHKPLDSIEGIYFYDNYYSVGLVKISSKEYIGVVLDSKTPVWEKGQIAIHLYEYLPNYFKAIYGHPKFKYYILYPIEKYSYHSLINSSFYSSFTENVYSKIIKQTDYVNLPNNIEDFHLKNITPDIQYLHIKHFSADNVAMQKSMSFYDSIKNSLTAPNLILDLRNNEGGAEKVSYRFLQLLKSYVNQGRVYILVNNGTLSQGEIFTLQLKQLKNVQILGQTTKGMLMYGSNYGKREKLPSQAFEVYITDMSGDKRLIPYENYGITPDIILMDNKDWIDQTIEKIRSK